MNTDTFVWWCGGQEKIAGEPEVYWPREERGEQYPEGSEAHRLGLIDGALIICSGCGHLAPFANGCRWIEAEGREG